MPPRAFPEDWEARRREVMRLGRMLGGESLNAAESITELTSDVVVGGARRDVDVPTRDDLPERMRERVEKIKASIAAGEPTGRRTTYHSIAEGKTSITTEVQVLRIGSAFIVGLPSEVFVEYQIEIRERSGSPHTFVSELANDTISYIPTPEAYVEGGYEPRSSALAPTAGATLVDAAIELVDQLRRG